MARQEAAAELAALRKAMAAGDWTALEPYGDINGALRRMGVLAAACAGGRRSRAAITTRPDVALAAGAGMDPCRPRCRRGRLTRGTTPATDVSVKIQT